jgi:hypothetical protein
MGAYLGCLGGRDIGKMGGKSCAEDEGVEEAAGGGGVVLEDHDLVASAAFGGGSLGGRRRVGSTPCHCWPLASSKEVFV